jgi:hypothetical protein
MFDGLYFDQIDGQAMGAPLAPTFTEFFMINFEKKYMDIIEEYGVEVWLRYVDDIFILIRDKDKALELLNKLNFFHPSIKFTYEPEKSTNETNDTFELPFLDVRCHE